MQTVTYHITGNLKPYGKRTISKTFTERQDAIDWLNQQWTNPVFRIGWQGGKFSIVKTVRIIEHRYIKPKDTDNADEAQ